ncbi:MAG: hypothetical protein ACRD0C_09935 [Acidimicrobiia bacterium]
MPQSWSPAGSSKVWRTRPLNYRTILVSDANAALSDEEHNMSLANVLTTFGDVLSTDEVIAALIAEVHAVPGHSVS